METRKQIDFDKLNRRRISILCKSHSGVISIKEHLESKGFFVEVETSVTNFFTLLCNQQPGFALVSRNLEGSMAKQLPEFLQKRFKIPIMLFQEVETNSIQCENPIEVKSSKILQNSTTAEIIHLKSSSAEDLENHINEFENHYLNSLSKLKKTAPPSATLERQLEAYPKSWSRLKNSIEPVNGEQGSSNHSTHLDLYNVKVKDPFSENLILIALPDGSHEEKNRTLHKIEIELKKESDEVGEIQAIPENLAHALFGDLCKKANDSTSGMLLGSEVHISIFNEVHEPDETSVSIFGSHFLVPIEDWWTTHGLAFHAYLWLAINHKKILYVKRGSRLSQRSLENFRKYNLNSMMINAEDMPTYRSLRQIVSLAT